MKILLKILQANWYGWMMTWETEKMPSGQWLLFGLQWGWGDYKRCRRFAITFLNRSIYWEWGHLELIESDGQKYPLDELILGWCEDEDIFSSFCGKYDNVNATPKLPKSAGLDQENPI